MDQAVEIQKIEARQAEIKAQMDVLQAEHDENETALRVIARFSDANGAGKNVSTTGTPRPDGLPTIFEMVVAVLDDAAETSGHGLTGREIVDAIGVRFWPGIASTQILPSVYRFAKTKRLRKTKGGKFSTIDQGQPAPKENEGTAVPPEANTGSVHSAPGVLNLHPSRHGQ